MFISIHTGENTKKIQQGNNKPHLIALIGGNGEKSSLSPDLDESPFKMFSSPETKIESPGSIREEVGSESEETEGDDASDKVKKKLTLMLARPLKYFEMGKYMPHIDAGNPALVLPSGDGDGTFAAIKVFPPYVSHFDKSLIPVYNKNGKKIANVPYDKGLQDFRSDNHKKRFNIPQEQQQQPQQRGVNRMSLEILQSSFMSMHLSFENYHGNQVEDDSENKNNGRMWGAATTMATNYSCGMACRLMSGAVVLNANSFRPKPTKAVSVAAWLKMKSVGGRHILFSTSHETTEPGAGHFHFEVRDGGQLRWLYTGEVFDCWTSNAVVEVDKWVHVTGTYDSLESKFFFKYIIYILHYLQSILVIRKTFNELKT